jgi:hypothetical protein
MQHSTKATQQAKTLFDETTQIELVEQANTLIIIFIHINTQLIHIYF